MEEGQHKGENEVLGGYLGEERAEGTRRLAVKRRVSLRHWPAINRDVPASRVERRADKAVSTRCGKRR